MSYASETVFSGRILPENTSETTVKLAKPYDLRIEHASDMSIRPVFQLQEPPPSPHLIAPLRDPDSSSDGNPFK